MSTSPPPPTDVQQIAASAFAHQAHASTYRLVDKTDPSRGGTAVAIKIGARCFLATARHVIPNAHEVALVLRDSVVEELSGFAARHLHQKADVGLLELHDRDMSLLGDTFVTPDRFLLGVDQSQEGPVTVIGFPGDLIRDLDTHQISEEEYVNVFVCSAFTFLTVALPLNEWPKSGTETEPIPGRDIFIDFHPESTMRLLHPAGAGKDPPVVEQERPHPRGISGGGIWVMKKATAKEVWEPRALLCGIQFGYNPKDGWLRGMLLNVWLEIVRDNYPDLRSELQRLQPERPD